MVEAADTLQWRVDAIKGVDPSLGDYAVFNDLNIPIGWCRNCPPLHPYYHTEKDTLQYATELPVLAAATEVTALAALELATSDKRL